MAAQWIGDGSEIPATPLNPAPVLPYREWRIGRYEFRWTRSRGRWTVQTAEGTGMMCGAAGYRTPVAAFFATWRTLRRQA